MKSRIFASIAIGSICVLSFCYGVAVAKYRVFPYEQLSALKRALRSGNDLAHSDYYYLKKTFFEQHGGHKYDVVFVGDSLTDHAEWEDLFPSLKIANRGIGGDRTDGILQRLDSIYSTSAEKAFIMVGVNDFFAGIGVDKVFQNYKDIINSLVSRGMAVYVQSTILTSKGNKQLNQKIEELNKRLIDLASKTERVAYIDLNEELAPNGFLEPRYSRDGIHLNGSGYAVWGELIKDATQ